MASVGNWVNTDLVRLLSIDRNRMTLRTPPLSIGETIQTIELTWERLN